MTSPFFDPHSVAGRSPHVAERTQVLVVGAGPAGLAAAIEAASLGLQVVLVDENPVPLETMGEDVPLHFGQRIGLAARNRNAMMEAFVETDPAIAEAFEAGVDVRLCTTAWGLYANGPNVSWMPGPVAGLSEGGRSWLTGFDAAIVATGRRDMGLAFPGWEQPGVMGATAAHRLAARYGALDARRAVMLGSSAEALAAALAMREAGIEIVAIVEHEAAPVGPADLLQGLGTDVPFLTRHVPLGARGGASGVESLTLARIGEDGRPLTSAPVRIECDTLVLGIGFVPVIDLLDALGCRIAFSPERSGYVPVLDAAQATSIPFVHAVGDCAGIWPAKSLDPDVARREGRAAARHIAGQGQAPSPGPADRPDAPCVDPAAYRLGWVRAATVGAEGEPFVCQCEEVTAREILEVRPPRYLGVEDKRSARDLASLLGEGAPNPDQVKRLTRAGMGLCQGRRCREQVAVLLALGAGVPLGDMPLASYRAPVRPLPLSAAVDPEEPAAMRAHWDTWFGIPTQYRGAWELPPLYTVASRDPTKPSPTE